MPRSIELNKAVRDLLSVRPRTVVPSEHILPRARAVRVGFPPAPRVAAGGSGVAGPTGGADSLPPASPSPPLVIAPAPCPAALEREPVVFTFRATGGAIDAYQVGPIPGHVIVHRVELIYSHSESDMNTTDVLLRVDLHDQPGLDTFSYAAGSYPDGSSSARKTIFDLNADSGEHLRPGRRFGWAWFQVTSTAWQPAGAFDVNIRADFDPVYIKVYFQQEDPTDRTTSVRLIISRGVAPDT